MDDLGSSFTVLAHGRFRINSGVLTELSRQGILSGFSRVGAGHYALPINTPVSLDRCRSYAFFFFPALIPPIVPASMCLQFSPFSGNPAASEESAGFNLFLFDELGNLADPPDDTSVQVSLEQSPF